MCDHGVVGGCSRVMNGLSSHVGVPSICLVVCLFDVHDIYYIYIYIFKVEVSGYPPYQHPKRQPILKLETSARFITSRGCKSEDNV